MKRLLNKTKEHLNKDGGLLKAGLIFLIGSITAAVFNMLYQFSMGRMLGPEQYGVLGSLFAIIYFVMFLSTTFNTVISKMSAELHGKNEADGLKVLIQRAFFGSIVFGAAILAVYMLISPLIAVFLRVNALDVILVGCIAYASFIASILTGGLNGLQKFVWQNASSMVTPFLKFSLAVVFVYLGFSVRGALVAILIGIITSILIASYPMRGLIFHKIKQKFETRKFFVSAIPVFLSSVFLMLIITVDLFLVKHFFTDAEAGQYSAAVMIARMIWFGSGFLVGALFPKVVSLIAQGKDASKLLIKTLIYTCTLIIIGVSVYFVMPTFLVNLLYGKEYVSIAPYIGIFGIALGMFSLTQVLVHYNIAKEQYGFIYVVFFALLVEIFGIWTFHGQVYDAIKVMFGANALMLLGMLIYNRKDLGVNFAE